jgi:leucyl-tRNA synthetase
MHKTIKKVTEDISEFKYNTAIAALMEWYNFLSGQEKAAKEEAEVFLKLLAPFAPFMTEELWHKLDNTSSIHMSNWPEFDEKYLESKDILIVIQINGKKRGELKIQKSEVELKEKLESQAREIVKKHLENREVKKTINVPGKIINFVI